MQEIAPQIYIETSYAGVTLGAINWPHGLVLIDAPFRAEDARSWRSALLNLGGGVERMLINMDAHMDRTIGVRAMDCTVVGHEKMAGVFSDRPMTFKGQPAETGSEWEQYNGLGSVRWAPPEITFSDRMYIHWDGSSMLLEAHPGPAVGSIWVELPEHQVVFVGDAAVPNQPPFLSHANLPDWIETLKTLLTPKYRSYLVISGRGGLIHMDDVRRQLTFLERAQTSLEDLAGKHASAEDTARLVDYFLSGFTLAPEYASLHRQRLVCGLYQYYQANHAALSEAR